MYEGIDGFLGTRASFMLDVVFVAMFAVIPILAWSIWLVRYRQNYALHKRVQLVLVAVLGVTVGLFELDIRINGWRHRAEESPYYAGPGGWGGVEISLAIHLLFAITTFVLWVFVVVRALRNFPHPPLPAVHSRSHRFWGWAAAIDMLLTALTGWIFYLLAFAA